MGNQPDMKKQLETLKKDVLFELNRINAFVVNTRTSYALAREKVKEGHECPADDPRWAVSLEMVANFEFYEQRLLPKLAFLHVMEVFECFLFDLLRQVLRHASRLLPPETPVPVAAVRKARSRREMIDTMVEAFLKELHARPVEDWFAFFNEALLPDVPTEEEVARLRELFAARDMLYHANPVVDKAYLRVSGSSGRWKAGATAETKLTDFSETCRFLQTQAGGLCDRTAERIRVNKRDGSDGGAAA
jgi:hypothetical protein